MKRLLFIILILMLAWNAYAIPPTPPVAAGDGSGDVLAGTMGSTGQYCTKNAATKTIDCNTTPSYQAALDIAKGTYTNTYLCKYTSSGTLLDCNVDPATFQTAITFGTGVETALGSAPDADGGLLSVAGLGSVTQAYSAILDGLAGVTPANNGIFGYDNSGVLGLYTSHQHDDSAAQFYSATADKGTMKFLLSGSTNGKLLTVEWNHTDDKTLKFPDPTTGDSVTYGSAPIRFNTGGATARVKGISDAADTIVELTQTQTLTNKTLTTPVITSLEVLIDCNGSEDPYAYCTGANASTLTATQTSRTIINSYGRGEAQTVTLPAAATGMTFIAMVGTQHNSAWKIQRAGSDTITWSSGGTDTAGKTYFQETNQGVGSRVSCITYKSGASAWSWLCGSVTGTWATD